MSHSPNLRSVCVAVFVACLAQTVRSQVVEDWVARYDGPAHTGDLALGLAVDANRNVYVTGTSSSATGGQDYATIKYSADGDSLWAHRYGGTRGTTDQANAIVVDASGNVYVTGYADNFTSLQDYATIKYDASGNVLWVRSYNRDNSYDQAEAIAVDANGNVYVTGHTWHSSSQYDYTTIKYDPAGNELWASHFNGAGNGYDKAHKLMVDASGYIYVTGYTRGSGTLDDLTTIKYEPDGDTAWVRSYNGPANNNEEGFAIGFTPSGDIVVTGKSIGSGTSYDYVTIEFDPNGNAVWTTRFDGGGGSIDVPVDLAIDGSGNVYVTGAVVLGPFGSYERFGTVKYNASGTQQWVRIFALAAFRIAIPKAIEVDAAGHVYVSGRADQVGPFYDYATISYDSDGDSLWTVRYNGPPGDNFDYPYALVVDDDRNVYVTGQSEGGAGTGPDYATVKYRQLPDITIDPEQVDFAVTDPGSSDDRTITIRNDGIVNLNIAILGAPALPFTIEFDSCSATMLSAGDSCHVGVRFSPAAGGYFHDSVVIPSNDPDEDTAYARLNGVGEDDTLQIFSVDSQYVVTNHPATFHVTGKKFVPGMEAWLDRGARGEPGRQLIVASSVNVIDSTELDATFDLELLDLGEYDLTLSAPDGSMTTATGAVFLLYSLVLAEPRHGTFGGFPIGGERASHLYVKNEGNDSGYVLVEIEPPHTTAIELRIMKGNTDTLWHSVNYPEDSAAFLMLFMAPEEEQEILLHWRVRPDRVIFFPVAPQAQQFHVRISSAAQDDDEYVPLGSDAEFVLTVINGGTMDLDDVIDLLKGSAVVGACAGLGTLLANGDASTAYENAWREALSELRDGVRINSLQDIVDKVAEDLGPGWAGMVDLIRSCTEAFIKKFFETFDAKVQENAQKFCQLSMPEKDRALQHIRAGQLQAFQAVLEKKTRSGKRVRGTIRGPLDPNDKATMGNYIAITAPDADSTDLIYLIPSSAFGDSIAYTILFENKAQATDSAQNVVIVDTLDADLDPNTLEIDTAAAKHVRGSFSWSLVGQILTVEFTDIKLPPNQIPPQGEWGVSFTVMMIPGLPLGTEIRNHASIYFDFNPAIVTPEVTLILGAPTILAAPADVEFGELVTHSSVVDTAYIKNVGGYELAIGEAVSMQSPFSVIQDDCMGDTLAPGDSCAITLSFGPLTTGEHADTLEIPSTDLANYPLGVPLHGSAICTCDCNADPQCDGFTDIVDVVNAVNVAFRGLAPLPDPNTACPYETTDADCTGSTDVVDAVKFVNVAFRGANAATEFCNPCL